VKSLHRKTLYESKPHSQANDQTWCHRIERSPNRAEYHPRRA